jgi:uncharacterized protein (TIGR03067 family)
MKPPLVGLFVIGLASLASAGDGPEKMVQDDLAGLQGSWQIISYEKAAVKYPPCQLQLLPTLVFKGRDYTWADGETGTITLIDPSKKPKIIEYKRTSGPMKNTTELAIYKIEGDSFTDCIAPPGAAEHPKDFSTSEENGQILIVYKRLKE